MHAGALQMICVMRPPAIIVLRVGLECVAGFGSGLDLHTPNGAVGPEATTGGIVPRQVVPRVGNPVGAVAAGPLYRPDPFNI